VVRIGHVAGHAKVGCRRNCAKGRVDGKYVSQKMHSIEPLTGQLTIRPVISRRNRPTSAMMRSAVQGGPRSMNTLQVGDWVQSDTGAAGTIMVISDHGCRAYIEVAHGTLGEGLVSFPVARLHKTERPNPAKKQVVKFPKR
jgi:hypothetical protein